METDEVLAFKKAAIVRPFLIHGATYQLGIRKFQREPSILDKYMKRAIIIDDDPLIIKVLNKLIKDLDEDLQVVGEAESVKTGIDLVSVHQPDVLFLDIELPDGSGFDVIDQVDIADLDVIFITSHDQYALQAIKASAVDYLMKPVKKEDLQKAISKLSNQSSANNNQALDQLRALLEPQSKRDKKIAIPVNDGLEMFAIDDILYCEAEGAYTIVELTDNRRIISSKNLKGFQESLEYQGFVRIHHKHLINCNHIQKYYRGDGGHVLMQNGKSLDVSRRKKEDLIAALRSI